MPQRVYKEWTTWGEFLGTTNVFQKYEKGSYRPYWEAVRWAQKLCKEQGLSRSIDCLHYYDANESGIPKDIPKNAHYHYKEDWKGWATWLGSTVEVKLDSAKKELAVFALTTQSFTSPNVIRVVVANSGMAELAETVREEQLTVVKAYEFEREQAETLQSVMQACGKQQPDGTFIVNDMSGLLFEFQSLLVEAKA